MKVFSRLYPRSSDQRGASMILTAFFIPVAVSLMGFTMDCGTAYYRYSQLQNATDAAVLAGANAYYNYRESTSSHPRADQEAARYISGDKNNLPDQAVAELSGSPTYQAKIYNDTTYYHVKATQEVSTIFLRHLPGMKETITVHAASTAAISSQKDTSEKEQKDGKQLFIFQKGLNIVNSIENPDRVGRPNDPGGKIVTTFDGGVAYTDDHANYNYSAQSSQLHYLFTELARKKDLGFNEAIAQNNPSDENKRYTSQITKTTYDFDALWNSVARHVSSNPVTDQNPNASTFANQQYVTFNTDRTNNINLTIDRAIAGDSNQPVYMLIKAGEWSGLSVLNVNLNADTRRPLIICLDPDNARNRNQDAKIHINLNGHTFRGIVYAKNMSDEGVLINANGGTFQGSIMAKSINLQGGAGTYRYEYFQGISPAGQNSGSSSGNEGSSPYSGSKTPKITLTSPEGLTWD